MELLIVPTEILIFAPSYRDNDLILYTNGKSQVIKKSNPVECQEAPFEPLPARYDPEHGEKTPYHN
ncbi:hypothetical protein GCM10027185_38150 [Spirosoma pulveris]